MENKRGLISETHRKSEQIERAIGLTNEVIRTGASKEFPFEAPEAATVEELLDKSVEKLSERGKFIQSLQTGVSYNGEYPSSVLENSQLAGKTYRSPFEELQLMREVVNSHREEIIKKALASFTNLAGLGLFDGNEQVLRAGLAKLLNVEPATEPLEQITEVEQPQAERAPEEALVADAEAPVAAIVEIAQPQDEGETVESSVDVVEPAAEPLVEPAAEADQSTLASTGSDETTVEPTITPAETKEPTTLEDFIKLGIAIPGRLFRGENTESRKVGQVVVDMITGGKSISAKSVADEMYGSATRKQTDNVSKALKRILNACKNEYEASVAQTGSGSKPEALTAEEAANPLAESSIPTTEAESPSVAGQDSQTVVKRSKQKENAEVKKETGWEMYELILAGKILPDEAAGKEGTFFRELNTKIVAYLTKNGTMPNIDQLARLFDTQEDFATFKSKVAAFRILLKKRYINYFASNEEQTATVTQGSTGAETPAVESEETNDTTEEQITLLEADFAELLQQEPKGEAASADMTDAELLSTESTPHTEQTEQKVEFTEDEMRLIALLQEPEVTWDQPLTNATIRKRLGIDKDTVFQLLESIAEKDSQIIQKKDLLPEGSVNGYWAETPITEDEVTDENQAASSTPEKTPAKLEVAQEHILLPAQESERKLPRIIVHPKSQSIEIDGVNHKLKFAGEMQILMEYAKSGGVRTLNELAKTQQKSGNRGLELAEQNFNNLLKRFESDQKEPQVFVVLGNKQNRSFVINAEITLAEE